MTEADAYELAAGWHDKNAMVCRDIAKDEPRIDVVVREKAKVAASHHAASAAALRNLAYQLRRKALAVTD